MKTDKEKNPQTDELDGTEVTGKREPRGDEFDKWQKLQGKDKQDESK